MILRIEYDTRFKTFWFFTRSLSIGPILLHSDCTSSSTSGSKLGSFCQILKQLNRKFLTSRDYPYWNASCSSAQTTPAISTRSTFLRIIPCRNPKSISYTDDYTRFLKYKRKDVGYWKMHIKWKLETISKQWTDFLPRVLHVWTCVSESLSWAPPSSYHQTLLKHIKKYSVTMSYNRSRLLH